VSGRNRSEEISRLPDAGYAILLIQNSNRKNGGTDASETHAWQIGLTGGLAAYVVGGGVRERGAAAIDVMDEQIVMAVYQRGRSEHLVKSRLP
jgi:hypothetical protein